MRGRSAAERETIVRWDEEERVAWLSTTSPTVRDRWAKKGVTWTVHSTVKGVPCSWAAKVDARAIAIRRVGPDGQLVKANRKSNLPRLRANPAGDEGGVASSLQPEGPGVAGPTPEASAETKKAIPEEDTGCDS